MVQDKELVGAPENRASVRIDVDRVPAELIVNICGHLTMSSAHIINLSASGALLEVTRGWPIGTEVLCDFALSEAARFSVSGAVVRRVELTSLSKVSSLAVHFWIRPGTDSRLMRWILEEMARRRKLGLNDTTGIADSKK